MPRTGTRMSTPGLPRGAETLLRGLPLRELLRLSMLREVRVLGGAAGVDRVVKRLNVMTLPEILPWVKENELLLTTGYPLPRSPKELADLVGELDKRRLAGFGIKLGQYVDQLPDQMLRRADDLGFPVLEIPHEVAFDDILSRVLTDIANRETATLIRSEEIHRAFMQIVLEGGGLPEITGELAKLLGGSVAAIDSDDQVLADSGLDEVSDQLVAAGLIDAGGRLRLDDAITSGAFQVAGIPLAVVPISAGALHYGRLVAVETGQSLPSDTLLALERAAMVAALDVTKELAVAAVERKYRSDFLHDLLMGRQDKPDDVDIRAKMLGWDLSRPLVVIVAEGEPAPPGRGPVGVGVEAADRLQSRTADGWTSAVRAHDSRAAVAAFSRELVAIVGAVEPGGKSIEIPAVTAGVAARMRDVTTRTFSYGASRRVEGVRDLPEAYKQASHAAKIGRQVHGPGAVTMFDSLGVFRLLSRVHDEGELRSFVLDTLGPVLRLRERERDDLLHTLTVLIDSNLNLAAAAKVLHFHYNTVRYRVAKLERMLGPFTVDRHVCHRISVALQIIQLRGLDSPLFSPPVRSSFLIQRQASILARYDTLMAGHLAPDDSASPPAVVVPCLRDVRRVGCCGRGGRREE